MPTKLALLEAERERYELKVKELRDELTSATVILDALNIAWLEETKKQEVRERKIANKIR